MDSGGIARELRRRIKQRDTLRVMIERAREVSDELLEARRVVALDSTETTIEELQDQLQQAQREDAQAGRR